MALNAALMAKERVGGVVGLSGEVFVSLQTLIDEDTDNGFKDKKENLPIFLYHGKADEVINYGYAAKSYEKLKASGFEKV